MLSRSFKFLLCMFLFFAEGVLADAVSVNALTRGGADTRDLQLREIRDVLRGGRGGFFDLGFNFTPTPSQLPLETSYGEHKGFATRQHADFFLSGEVKRHHDVGVLLWFERHGWDSEDFILFPKYSDFSLVRSVTTWGLTYTQSEIGLTLAGGMQHQNVEHVGNVYPAEHDSLLYEWAHVRWNRVSLQGSFHRTSWREARLSLDLEARSVFGGPSSGFQTYLPNVDLTFFNTGDDRDSVLLFWEQNLYGQLLYGEVTFDLTNDGFRSAALKFYPDPSRMMAFEATCLRRHVRSGHEDLLWGGGVEFPFLRIAYNSSYEYDHFFGAKGTLIVEFQFNIGTIDGFLFSRGGARSAPMETMRLKNKDSKNEFKDTPSKTIEARGVRFEKTGNQGGR